MDTLGEKLHLLRKQSGYSQEELAYKVDVTRQTVSLWESNSLIPKADKLKALCKIFNVSSDYLLFDSTEPATEQGQSNQIDNHDRADGESKSDNLQTKKKGKNKVVIVAATLLALFLLCLIVLVCLMVVNIPDGGYETVTAIRFAPDVLLWLIIIVSVIVVVFVVLLVISLIKARKR